VESCVSYDSALTDFFPGEFKLWFDECDKSNVFLKEREKRWDKLGQ